MCGIFGAFTENEVYRKKLLAVLNVSRGDDSCGFWDGTSRLRFHGSIIDALSGGHIKDNIFASNVFLGHTRNASVGTVNKENAHPFRVGHIVGAHNGTLRNWWDLKNELAKEDGDVSKFEVDSQLIFYIINKFGYKGLSRVVGKAAVWWVDDREPESVYFWIWNQTLAVAKSPFVAFSSDGDHLKACGFKNVYNVKDDGQVCVYPLGEDKIYQHDVVKGGTEKVVVYTSSGYSGYDTSASYKPDGFIIWLPETKQWHKCDSLGVIKGGEKEVEDAQEKAAKAEEGKYDGPGDSMSNAVDAAVFEGVPVYWCDKCKMCITGMATNLVDGVLTHCQCNTVVEQIVEKELEPMSDTAEANIHRFADISDTAGAMKLVQDEKYRRRILCAYILLKDPKKDLRPSGVTYTEDQYIEEIISTWLDK